MANKLKIASNSFFMLSILLIVIMLIKIYIDYQTFIKHPEWSAPFSAYLIVHSVYFGIPLIVTLVLAVLFKYKTNKKYAIKKA